MTDGVSTIGILGGGAWGTALATVVARAGLSPLLWVREPAVIAAINGRNENPDYLSGVSLPDTIRATGAIDEVARTRVILSAVPAQVTREVLTRMAPDVAPDTALVICAKGIETATATLMSDAARAALPQARPAILSGPSFAADVARGLPTAITLAADDLPEAERLSGIIGIPTFRPYASADMIGAQIGGAVKNVLAIACGIVDGRKLGTSARAALTTRGFAEMTRLGIAMGGRTETLAGLSGLGDLVLTCNSPMSRNNALGQALGEGLTLRDALDAGHGVAEGAYTAQAVETLAGRHGVEMPIARAVADVLRGSLGIDAAIDNLLNRPFRTE